jgi:hypothetical protein
MNFVYKVVSHPSPKLSIIKIVEHVSEQLKNGCDWHTFHFITQTYISTQLFCLTVIYVIKPTDILNYQSIVDDRRKLESDIHHSQNKFFFGFEIPEYKLEYRENLSYFGWFVVPFYLFYNQLIFDWDFQQKDQSIHHMPSKY